MHDSFCASPPLAVFAAALSADFDLPENQIHAEKMDRFPFAYGERSICMGSFYIGKVTVI